MGKQKWCKSILIDPDFLWKAVPFLVPILLMVLILLFDTNQSLFLKINRLPVYTGKDIWAWFTIFGDGLVITALFFPWIRRRPDAVWSMLFAAIISTAIVHSLKPIFNIPRPPKILPSEITTIIGPTYYYSSFPSGHSVTIFNAVGVWCLLLRNRLVIIGLLLFAYLVGMSRICVGIHWPLDVLAGALIGWGTAWIGTSITGKLPKSEKPIGRIIVGFFMIPATVYLLLWYDCRYDMASWLQRVVAAICLTVGIFEFLRLIFGRLDVRKGRSIS